tara:strand:+ start:331 stop:729 length:399 start_codon:yes stop_codon:yes gene_type:complete
MSKKFIPKKIREPIDCYEESTWLANGTPIFEDSIYAIWEDKFPVTPGHLLFIPKRSDISHVRLAYGEAWNYGQEKVELGEWDGFNIGQNCGLAAGQTILWPHIHVIPRHNDDNKDKGGIRRAIPNGDNKQYY